MMDSDLTNLAIQWLKSRPLSHVEGKMRQHLIRLARLGAVVEARIEKLEAMPVSEQINGELIVLRRIRVLSTKT